MTASVMSSARDRIKAGSTPDSRSGCWIWNGSVRSQKAPYGRLTVGSRSDGTRRSIGAHQLSYTAFVGEIADGLCVCHSCDNPRCVNPEHLFLGTKKDNADDRDRKGRNSAPPRIPRNANAQAKLSEQDVENIVKSTLSSRVIAKAYGVADGYIRAIRRAMRKDTPAPPTPTTKEDKAK